jgi:hypothetical protein
MIFKTGKIPTSFDDNASRNSRPLIFLAPYYDPASVGWTAHVMGSSSQKKRMSLLSLKAAWMKPCQQPSSTYLT